jgi:hypothetical protein
MRWWNRFSTSLLFAILVAGVYPIYIGIAGTLIGRHLAFSVYLLATAAIYLLGIARHPTVGLAAGAAVFGSGVLMIVCGASAVQLGLMTGLLIGVFRSGLLQGGDRALADRFGRHFVREFFFVGGGTAFAIYFANGSHYPGAFALWGFYLVQSGFFLLGGQAARDRSRPASHDGIDDFTRAVKRAREVLAETTRSTPHP